MIPRQKTLIVILALYWPAIFILTHIPIPDVVREAQVSDKSLHFLAYMVLAFLFWSALRPAEKAHWRRPAMWWILLALAAYALVDEALQYFVEGRSPDWHDVLANIVGTLAGLAITATVSFWPGAVIVTGATIYISTIFTRANLTRLLPVTSTMLHLATYGLFTLLWIGCMAGSSPARRPDRAWYVRSLSAPMVLLLVTKISAAVSGKEIEVAQIAAGVGGIIGAVAIAALVKSLWPASTNDAQLSAAEA